MNLSWSEEHRMLKASVERFAVQRYTAEVRRRVLADDTRFDADVWRDLAAYGWLALCVPEAHGGVGGSAVDVSLIAEGLGKALVLEPYLPTAVVAARLIGATGTADQCERLLPRIAAGDVRIAFAHEEPQQARAECAVRTIARRAGDGWTLSGSKLQVVDGVHADVLLVSARIERDGQRGELAVFAVPENAVGLHRTPFETIDGRIACHLTLQQVRLASDARLGDACAEPAVAAALDAGIAALCAEAVGAMQALLDATLDYSRTREQFGQPLSANQVVRHRLVDMAIACEEARAMALLAAITVDGEPQARSSAASGARLKIARAGRFVAEQAVQLHGAMGVTEELSIGALMKRLMFCSALFGTPEYHLERRAQIEGYVQATSGAGLASSTEVV